MIDRILTRHTGLVHYSDRVTCYGRLLIVGHDLQGAFAPDDAVEVSIDGPHDRRRQAVAVEVLHIAHGEVHRAFVDLARLRLDIDEQVGFLIGPVKRQVGKQSAVAHRRKVSLVGLWREVVDEQRLYLLYHLAVGVAEDALVVGAKDLLHNTGRIAFNA